MPIIYDAYGRPVDLAELTEEKAGASLTGVRNVWAEAVASGLTPAKLGRLLADSAEGDARAYLTLAEEMEERELHYLGVLGVRKRAVAALPVQVEAATDDKDDVKIADAVRELTAAPEFDDLAEDMLDALGKGYSVSEIAWDRSGKTWTPERYDWRDPRFFVFDQETGRQLRVLTDTDAVYGEPLAPFKFIVHYPRLKTGIPIRGGLARPATWAFMFKNFSVKDWMAFLEVFGMPLRMGRYDNNADPRDIAVLKAAVANLGHDAGAVFPRSMEIELAETKGGSSKGNVFQDMAIYQDRQVAYAVLGQTGTTEPTPGGLGQQTAQSEVRRDIRNADAKQLQKTLNRDLVRAFVDLNYGPQKSYPKIVFQTSEPEDLTALAANLEKLVPLGLRVEASQVRDRFNFADPAKDAECLGAPAAPVAEPAPEKAPNRRHLQALRRGPEQKSLDTGLRRYDERLALNSVGASGFTPDQEAIEGLVDKALPGAFEAFAENEKLILAAVTESETYEEAITRVLELYPALDAAALEDQLSQVWFAAEAFGRFAVTEASK